MPEGQATVNQYIDILEKTNHQLSLYWTPYNVIITILIALITIFTVVFGVIIYLQSTEYRKKLAEDRINFDRKIKDFFSKHDQQVKQLINEHKSKLKEIEKSYDALIEQ